MNRSDALVLSSHLLASTEFIMRALLVIIISPSSGGAMLHLSEVQMVIHYGVDTFSDFLRNYFPSYVSDPPKCESDLYGAVAKRPR